MPTISVFYGITIAMYWNEHGYPHFHATYGEYEAVVLIDELHLASGYLPSRVLALVTEWAELHREELRLNWHRCRYGQSPLNIPPLP